MKDGIEPILLKKSKIRPDRERYKGTFQDSRKKPNQTKKSVGPDLQHLSIAYSIAQPKVNFGS